MLSKGREKRDQKGLDKRTTGGEIAEFSSISAPYEEPEDPEIILETDKQGVDESIQKEVSFFERLEIIENPESTYHVSVEESSMK